jgi:hypothetical protein
MTVKKLREKLQENGYSEEELKDLGKQDLEKLLDALSTVEETLSQAEEVTGELVDLPVSETQENTTSAEPQMPRKSDPEWTDFVLTQFIDREKDQDGNPKVDGLRRVAEKLLGEFSIDTEVVQAPSFDRGATVVVKLEFLNRYGAPRIVCGAADVSTANTQREYAIHSVATAETRAEGRALRKALGLTKVLAAEELLNADADEPNGTERISTGMVTSLKVMCQKVNVDLEALAQKLYNVQEVGDLTSSQGRKVANKLYEFNSGKEDIPDDVKTISI